MSCATTAATFIPVLKPWPVTPADISGPASVCLGWTGQAYTVAPVANAITYEWNYSGSGATISGSSNAVAISFAANATAGNLSVRGHNDCGYGPISPLLPIVVNPLPVVDYTFCNDNTTTKNAKPFLLRGGSPAGPTGTYHLNSPAAPPLSGNIFMPSDPMVVTGSNTIFYTYSDVNNCKATAQKTIVVLPSNAAQPCSGTFTDPRDNSQYPLVQIGTQCWMQTNLRFAYSTLQFIDPQRDNCTSERYCLPSDPGCSAFGALYQWDELMTYNPADRAQGLCPPGWHIPNEAEWQVLVNFVSSGSGYATAASYLKNILAPNSFMASPQGFYYLNQIPAFTSSPKASFFWTSSYDPVAAKIVARGINEQTPSLSRYLSGGIDAFPVRCLKD